MSLTASKMFEPWVLTASEDRGMKYTRLKSQSSKRQWERVERMNLES